MKNNKEMETQDINTLIQKLQVKDSDYKKALRILQIFFFALVFIYTALYVFNPDAEMNLYQRIGGVCYVIAFTLLALHFRKKFTKYRSVNYSSSVKELMTEAEKRYRFLQKNKLGSIIAIILLDVGTCFILMKYSPDKWSILEIFIGVQAFSITSAAIGFMIGFIKWKKEIRPLWLAIKTQLKEFDE